MPDVLPPRALSDFDRNWLAAVLGAEITSVTPTEIAVGEGFTGRLVRLALEYADGPGAGPASVIGKIPMDEPGAVALGQLLRLWEREARFYTDVAPTLPVRTAACHYAGGYADEGWWSLLLEDLGFARCGDQVAGASLDDAERAIDWLAAFHATWWGRESEAYGWLPRVKADPTYQALQPMLEAVFPTFVANVGGNIPDEAITWTERAIPEFTPRMHEEPFPATIYHSDFRLDNLFFTDSTVIPIDWQALAVGQGMYDLAYFMGGCMPIELRRAAEHDLVERWRDGLLRHGVKMPSATDTFFEYRRMMLFVMLVSALLYGQLDFTVSERAGELARASAQRVFTAGVDLGVDELLPR